MDRPRVVWIKWHDATSFDHIYPEDIKDLKDVMISRENVGFLIKRTKNFTIIAAGLTRSLPSIDHTDNIREFVKIIVIPTAQIDKMEEFAIDEKNS